MVDTADTAKQCVKYIRDKGLGVATFLILKQQEHLAGQAAQKIKTPPGALSCLLGLTCAHPETVCGYGAWHPVMQRGEGRDNRTPETLLKEYHLCSDSDNGGGWLTLLSGRRRAAAVRSGQRDGREAEAGVLLRAAQHSGGAHYGSRRRDRLRSRLRLSQGRHAQGATRRHSYLCAKKQA